MTSIRGLILDLTFLFGHLLLDNRLQTISHQSFTERKKKRETERKKRRKQDKVERNLENSSRRRRRSFFQQMINGLATVNSARDGPRFISR
jgi:hypothetical protein